MTILTKIQMIAKTQKTIKKKTQKMMATDQAVMMIPGLMIKMIQTKTS